MIQMIKTVCLWVLCRLQHKRTRKTQPKPLSVKRQIAQGVRSFIEKNYELRYNTLKQTEEFRPRPKKCAAFSREWPTFSKKQPTFSKKQAIFSREWATHGAEQATHSGDPATHGAGQATPAAENAAPWKTLTDRELRRIALEQMEKVGVAWSVDVALYVRSAMVSDYNPVRDYLSRCGKWDGTDRIRALARRVPCRFDRWADWFHRWFLAMVAQWMELSATHGNALVPMLIGPQGTRKSTFCRLLLPPELREYYIDDVKLDSAEQVERMLASMLLVNIDEYNAKTSREQARIKRLMTERDVQTRRIRSDQYRQLPRMASFVATTNEQEPLTDPTGSRRYLCCEVTGVIDTETPLDYAMLYAQAVSELQQGAAWHLDKAEEAELERHNARYRQRNYAEELLLQYFEPAERRKANFLHLNDILCVLRQHVSTPDVPSAKQLTLTLRNCRFPHGACNGRRGWYARLRQRETPAG